MGRSKEAEQEAAEAALKVRIKNNVKKKFPLIVELLLIYQNW